MKCNTQTSTLGIRGHLELALVFEASGRLAREESLLLKDLVATAAANGHCSPMASARWRTKFGWGAEADRYLRPLVPRVATKRTARFYWWC